MSDPRFSAENLEKAANTAQDLNSPDQQDAMDLINEWMQQPDSIFTALDLIRETNSFYASYIYSSLIKNKVPDYWGQTDEEAKNKYREALSELIFTVPDIENNISYNLIHALTYIAIFDWPDEYPNFTDIIFPADESLPLNVSFRILSTFMEELDTTKIITDMRRNRLRQDIITNYHDRIMDIISNYLMEPEFSGDILTICNYMLRWGSIDDIIDFELFQKLACDFLTDEDTCEKAVQCLNSIFISRTDSAVAFTTFSPFLADSLSKGTFPNEQPVTSNPHVIYFLLRFLHEYSSIFELVFNYDQAKEDPKVESFVDDNVSHLVDTMVEKGISTETLHDDLYNLYQVILSIPPEDIFDEIQVAYWQLWDNNMRRVNYEQNHEMPVNPSSDFFMPFFEDITQALFMALSSSIDEEGICIFQARTTIGSLYMINPDRYIEFLKAQVPSPQLCYGIGTIEFVLEQSKLESILLIVNELLQYAIDNLSPEYNVALLYALSHSTKCFQANSQLFSQFIDLAVNSMAGSEKIVADAATHALQYIVQRKAALFKGESRDFADILIGQSESYLNNLSPQSAIRIFKVCTWLISYSKRISNTKTTIIGGIEIFLINTNNENTNKDDLLDENSSQIMYEKLFEPIEMVISKPDQFPQEMVETALDIVRECCYASPSSSPSIFEYLWPSISELAESMIPNQAFSESSLSYILLAMSAMQSNLLWEQVGPQVDDIFQLIQNSQRIEDCFFEYFDIIRSNFSELDSLFPSIQQTLIDPLTESDDPLPPSLFLMIGQFSPDVVDVEWFTGLVIQALGDLRTDVGDYALSALQSMMYKLSRNNLNKFLIDIAPQLISAIIESIIDLMHKPLFSKSIDFLRFIIIEADQSGTSAKLEQYQQPEEDLQTMIKNEIVSALKQFANEPEDGFFDNFADYLISVQRQFFKFKSAFGNLLVVLKKASPGDAELFKIEPVQQNSLFSMIFGSFIKNLAPMFEIKTLDESKLSSRNRVLAKLRKKRSQQKIQPSVSQEDLPANDILNQDS